MVSNKGKKVGFFQIDDLDIVKRVIIFLSKIILKGGMIYGMGSITLETVRV